MESRNHPIKNLTDQLRKNHAFRWGNFSKISTFYLKLIAQEPFRIFEQMCYNKEVEQHELAQDPVFIIGHWRSGTSFLQYLLGKDPQFGYMNKFQAVFPDVYMGSEQALKSMVNLIPDTLNLVRDAQNMSIDLDLDSPSEIEIALTTMISPTSLHWGHIFPQDARSYFRKFLTFDTATNSEYQRWKHDYMHLIKKISLKNNKRQVLVKSPGNASRIKHLLKLYPKAQFIFIHRNPYDVFYSNKKLWNTLLDNLALQNFNHQQMQKEIIWAYKQLMTYYLKQRSAIPEQQLVEIRFENFIDDPVKILSNVYSQLSISGFERAVPHFQQFLASKTEGKASGYEYDKSVIAKLNEEWKFAFREWNYSIIKNRN